MGILERLNHLVLEAAVADGSYGCSTGDAALDEANAQLKIAAQQTFGVGNLKALVARETSLRQRLNEVSSSAPRIVVAEPRIVPEPWRLDGRRVAAILFVSVPLIVFASRNVSFYAGLFFLGLMSIWLLGPWPVGARFSFLLRSVLNLRAAWHRDRKISKIEKEIETCRDDIDRCKSAMAQSDSWISDHSTLLRHMYKNNLERSRKAADLVRTSSGAILNEALKKEDYRHEFPAA